MTIRRNVLVAFLAMSTVGALGQNPKGEDHGDSNFAL